MKPQRSFNADVGQTSIEERGPDAIEHDLDAINRMFDPSAIHENGQGGGIMPENMGFKVSVGITWRGEYDNDTEYAVEDGVTYEGSSYRCIEPSLGNIPTNSNFWAVVALKGADGIDGINGVDGVQLPNESEVVTDTAYLVGGVLQVCYNTGPITILVPSDATDDMPIDTETTIVRYGPGSVEIQPEEGVLLNSSAGKRNINAQYESVTVRKMASNEWWLSGAVTRWDVPYADS